MKGFFAFALILALLSPCALQAADTVSGSNVFGLLPVYSLTKRTIVAVPWCECSENDNQAISVSNIVKTANLTVGDTLHALDASGDTLDTWTLQADSDGVKYWQSVKQVSKTGTATSTDSAAEATATRGTAVMLVRASTYSVTDNVTNALPFYLYGQVATSAATSTSTVTAGTSEDPLYNLIAAPSTNDVYLAGSKKNVTMSGTPNNDDRIFVDHPVNDGNGGVNNFSIELKYLDGAWKYLNRTANGRFLSESWEPYENPVKAGTGIWYVSVGGAPTFTWQGVPVK